MSTSCIQYHLHMPMIRLLIYETGIYMDIEITIAKMTEPYDMRLGVIMEVLERHGFSLRESKDGKFIFDNALHMDDFNLLKLLKAVDCMPLGVKARFL